MQKRVPTSTAVSRPPRSAPKKVISPPLNQKTYRQKLLSLFQQHDPSKVADVDVLLRKYAGREEQLLQSVRRRFGVAPTPLATSNAVPSVPQRKAEREPLSYRERLLRVLEQHDPTRVAQVDRILQKYAGKEAALIHSLEKKYTKGQTEPKEINNNNNNNNNTSNDNHTKGGYQSRLQAFFAQYDPTKVPQVDHFLEKYRGREEQMISALVHRYGPEPSETNPTDTSKKESPTVAPVNASLEGDSGRTSNTGRDAESEPSKPVGRESPKPSDTIPLAKTENDTHTPPIEEETKGEANVGTKASPTSSALLNTSEFLSLHSSEWRLTPPQEDDAAERLLAYYFPLDASFHAMRRHSARAERPDPLDGHLRHVPAEELRRWREDKQTRTEQLTWKQRKPIPLR